MLPNKTHDCKEIIGDGKVVGREKCDDGPLDAMRRACNENGSAPKPGWNCGNCTNICDNKWENGTTKCKEICGDGLLVGIETCDDGKDDLQGCKDVCVGA